MLGVWLHHPGSQGCCWQEMKTPALLPAAWAGLEWEEEDKEGEMPDMALSISTYPTRAIGMDVLRTHGLLSPTLGTLVMAFTHPGHSLV